MAQSSLEYWRQREAAQRDKNITEEAEYEKHIQKIYADTLDRVNKEINGFFVKYATKEGITIAEAKRRVSKLDIKEYSEKAKRYVEEKNFSEKANEEMRLYNLTMKVNRLELLKANIGLELIDGFSQLENYEGKILNDRTLAEMERQAGILGETVLEPAKKAHAIVNASFHNAQFSDRIWMYQDMLKSELSILLTRGLIQGLNPRQLAVDIKKRFGVSLSNATMLMRTEMARVQIGAQKQSYERNGYEEYEFIALTGHACEDCQALDGKHFKVIKMQPGLNAPPMHPNCKCSTSAYMDREAFDKWLDSGAADGLNWDEWNKEKTQKSQRSENSKDHYSAQSKHSIHYRAGRADLKAAYEDKRLVDAIAKIFHPEKPSSVVQKLREDFNSWIKTLSANEKASLKKYTRNEGDVSPNKFYQRINRGLREGAIEKQLERHVNNISQALKRGRASRDFIVYRGLDVDSTRGAKIGEPFAMNQFVSGSIIKSRAFNGAFSLEIWVKKGSAGIGYIEGISAYPSQREALLDKDCLYRVLFREENRIVIELL